MSTYCVSFRIANETVGGQTYSDRRNKLIENVHEGSKGYWEETTSFLVVGQELNTVAFANKACKGLSESHDMVFVFDPDDMSACYFGNLRHVDVLRSFFPKLQKVP